MMMITVQESYIMSLKQTNEMCVGPRVPIIASQSVEKSQHDD